MLVSSLKFGTSGLRGLAEELAGLPAYEYTLAFVDHMIERQYIAPGTHIALAQDLRSSSPEIARWCAAAIVERGMKVRNLEQLMTPALALLCQREKIPGIMVTGSHIPDDRNGLKFYRPDGEIDKTDEVAIIKAHNALTPPHGAKPAELGEHSKRAGPDFVARYADVFSGTLDGLKIGIYQHSSVARDLLPEILENAGAKVTPLGRSDKFIPVDTEALRPEDKSALEQWTSEHQFDAIVSTDGDADRPLIADERGQFVPGDTVGAMTARYLAAQTVVTPVTSNGAMEMRLCAKIVRTKVGSPFVIDGMEQSDQSEVIVGFEANGGVLLGTDIQLNGHSLEALATRDCCLPILCVLAEIKKQGAPLSTVVSDMQMNAKYADRLKDYPREISEKLIAYIGDPKSPFMLIAKELTEDASVKLDRTDGLKFIAQHSTMHFRPSGNAPELRIYCEASTEEQALALAEQCLQFAEKFKVDQV